ISGEVRIADACCEDYDAALFKVSDRTPSNIRFRNLFHFNRCEHTRFTAELFQAVLQCKGVHHSGKHTHVIRSPPVHSEVASDLAAPYVADAYNDRDLYAELFGVCYLLCNVFDDHRIDAEAFIPRQCFSAQFQYDTIICGSFRHISSSLSIIVEYSFRKKDTEVSFSLLIDLTENFVSEVFFSLLDTFPNFKTDKVFKRTAFGFQELFHSLI